jgi:hypothetical protein
LLPRLGYAYGGLAAVDLETLRLPPGDQHLVTLDLARVGPDGAWVPQAFLHYADRPLLLVCDEFCPPKGKLALIAHRLTLDLSLAVSIRDRLQLAVSLPVALYQYSDPQVADFFANTAARPPAPQVAGLEDAQLHAKVAFLPKTWRFGLGLSGALSLPTGNGDSYLGTRLPSFTTRLLGHGLAHPRVTLGASLGARLAATEQVLNLPSGIALAYSLGLQIQLLGLEADELPLFLIAEAYGLAYVRGSRDTDFPTEFLIAIKSEPGRFSVYTAAGGTLIAGAGTPDVRALIGLSYSSRR